MKNILNLFKRSDYITVYSDSAWWDVTTIIEFFGDKTVDRKYCFYEIQYSKNKNRYKLKTSGYRANEHGYKAVMLEKLSEFNGNLL